MVDVRLPIYDETSCQFDHGSGIYRTFAAPCACAGCRVCVIFFGEKQVSITFLATGADRQNAQFLRLEYLYDMFVGRFKLFYEPGSYGPALSINPVRDRCYAFLGI